MPGRLRFRVGAEPLGEAGRLGQRSYACHHQDIGLGQGIGQLGFAQPCRHLLLPEIEIAARELVGIGRIGHGKKL
jgi:hypothetical protein